MVSDTDGMGEVYDNIKTQQFRPKARKQDVDLYVESCRTKYGCSAGDQLTSKREGWVGGVSLDVLELSAAIFLSVLIRL